MRQKLRSIYSPDIWKKSYDKPRQHTKKQRYHFADKGPSSQGYGFSSGHVWMWELDCEEPFWSHEYYIHLGFHILWKMHNTTQESLTWVASLALHRAEHGKSNLIQDDRYYCAVVLPTFLLGPRMVEGTLPFSSLSKISVTVSSSREHCFRFLFITPLYL